MAGPSWRRLGSPISSGNTTSAARAWARRLGGRAPKGAERTPGRSATRSAAWQRRTYQYPVV